MATQYSPEQIRNLVSSIVLHIGGPDFWQGHDTEGIDEDASAERYADIVNDKLLEWYPNANVDVRWERYEYTPDWNRIAVTFADDLDYAEMWYGAGAEEVVNGDVDGLLSAVMNCEFGQWYVETPEAVL